MKIFQTFVFLLLLLFGCAYPARYALLAGNDTGGEGTSRLKYARNDLAGMRSTLVRLCGFKEKDIITLFNGAPADLASNLAGFQERVRGDSAALFLLYYSGHADNENLKMGEETFPISGLKQAFAAVSCPIRIGIFDACQSGIVTRIKGGVLAEPFLFKDDSKVEGQVILSSSSANENSQESDTYKSSVFTFHLLNALRGSADASGDRRVTLGEAYQYAYAKTIASTANASGGTQHPAYQFRIQGEGDIVLADLTMRTAGIALAEELEGAFTILDAAGAIAADFDKIASQTTIIALAPGSYQVFRTSRSAKTLAQVTIGDQEMAALGTRDFVSHASEPVSKKGEEKRKAISAFMTVSGGFDRMDLGDPFDSLEKRFSGYSQFGIAPTFAAPASFFALGCYTGEIAGELWFGGAFQALFGYRHFSSERKALYTGSRTNPFDNKAYGCRLETADTLSSDLFDLGVGYKIREGLLRNTAFHVGLCYYSIDFAIHSWFADSLYDIEAHSSYGEEGGITIPYAGISYTYALTRAIGAGVKIRYRYQKEPRELSSTTEYGDVAPMYYRGSGTYEPDPVFLYRMGGFDMHLFLTFNFLNL